MSAPDAKQLALAELISSTCATKVLPKLAEVQGDIAKLSIGVAAIQARLEILESLGSGPPKRATRAAAKPAGAKGGAKASTKTTEEKVTNTLLFFRYMLKNDLGGYREQYADEDALASVANDAGVAKKDREKDTAEYYSAAGAALWKTIDTAGREVIKAAYTAWKEDLQREGDAAPLEEGDAGEAGEAGDA